MTETVKTAGTQANVGTRAPLRGTQSFVGVLGQIWRRPGLTGIELLWRWGVGTPLLLLAWWAGSRALGGSFPGLAALGTIDVLMRPAEAAATVSRELGLLAPLLPILRWWLPLSVMVWSLASAFGRTWIWRRLDPKLQPRPLLVGAVGLLRSLGLLAMYFAWLGGIAEAGRYAISAPAAAGAEPNLVLYTALDIGITLLLFLLWSLTSWVLDAAQIFAMHPALGADDRYPNLLRSIGAAAHARVLRSKLIETNLVMGIVKVALLVLAMVFSASPLPFVSVETPAFLQSWWSFVGVLFLAALDLFHVVRRAAYLELFRALVTPQADTAERRDAVS